METIVRNNYLEITRITHPIQGLLHHAHCASVIELSDGNILVVYYHAKKEADKKQATYGKIYNKKTGLWGPNYLLSKDSSLVFEGNPVLWKAPDSGLLWLFYVTSFGGWSMCSLKAKTSSDDGKTWSKPTRIGPFISRLSKNPPILTSKGRYVLPTTIEFRDCMGIFYVSEDKGKTWIESNPVALDPKELPPNAKWGRMVDQPTIIERKNGDLVALCRAYMPLGKMLETVSTDGGYTWSPAKKSTLPNPDGGFNMIKLQSGNVAIIYNHAPSPPYNVKMRNPLSVALSEDEARTWKFRQNISETIIDEKTTDAPISYQYPTICQGSDGKIHAVWAKAYKEILHGTQIGFMDIEYCNFTEDWITKSPYFEQMWK